LKSPESDEMRMLRKRKTVMAMGEFGFQSRRHFTPKKEQLAPGSRISATLEPRFARFLKILARISN